MKKILLLFIFALFAVACSSATNNAFLEKVQGKSLVNNGSIFGTFSDDGKTFSSSTTFDYTFESADSENKGTYIYLTSTYIFEISGTDVAISTGSTITDITVSGITVALE